MNFYIQVYYIIFYEIKFLLYEKYKMLHFAVIVIKFLECYSNYKKVKYLILGKSKLECY